MTTHSLFGRNGIRLNKMEESPAVSIAQHGVELNSTCIQGPEPSLASQEDSTPSRRFIPKCCLTHSENDAEIGAAATERESSGRVWRQQKIRTDGGARDATGRRVRADRRVAVRGLRSAETGGPDVPARHGYKPLGGDGRKRVASALLLRVTAFSAPPVRPGDPGVQCRPG